MTEDRPGVGSDLVELPQNMKRPRQCVTTVDPGPDRHGRTAMSKRTCSIEHCDRKHEAHGFCSSHYRKWRAESGGPQSKPCSVEGCPDVAMTRGWCARHYKRWLRSGELGGPSREWHKSADEAFLARIRVDGDCLVWDGAISENGYASLWVEGRVEKAHRYAWERVNGPIPPGMDVDHRCWNRACCKVQHLRLATRSENSQNRSGPDRRSSTGVRNVYKADGAYRVSLGKGGKMFHFGTYSTLEEASRVARDARESMFGDFSGRG